MNEQIITHYENAYGTPIKTAHRYENRIGFWADVLEVDSTRNCCTVISDQCIKYSDIQVATKEWVVKDDNKDYAACERNLPPIGSRVFVLVPNGNIGSAFILCSGYPMGEVNTQTLWTDEDADQETIQQQNKIREKVTQGGWDKKEYYDNGNSSYTSADKNIIFEINPVEIKDDSGNVTTEQKVSLTAWDNSIILTKDGYTLTDKNNNSIQMTSEGIVITDVNNNVLKMNSSGFDFNGYLTIAKKES